MNREIVDQIVNAVLYEGYILYPYRASSKKNQRERFTFGRVYPKAYSDAQCGREPWTMQTECLVRNESHDAMLEVAIRFLQPSVRDIGKLDRSGSDRKCEIVSSLEIGNELYQAWEEAIERKVEHLGLALSTETVQAHDFEFAAAETIQAIGDGREGVIIRRNEALRGRVELSATLIGPDIAKISIRILNETSIPEAMIRDPHGVMMRTFASTHTILHTTGGEFISLLDPVPEQSAFAARCNNIGTWPVLVGDSAKGERDTMLSSPIILYDYPQVASESPGGFFDSTEIDELLTLRVKTMTDAEKMEMRNVDEQARGILERAESMSRDQLMRMHGTMRQVRSTNEDFFNPLKRLEKTTIHGVELKAGDRSGICPKKRADIMDMALEGKVAVIEALEQDVENQIHFALILEDDPGKDLGLMRQTGHRFFYGADEVEPV